MPTNLHLFLDCHMHSITEVTWELKGSASKLLLRVLKMLLNTWSKSWSAWVNVLKDGVEHGFYAFCSIRILVTVKEAMDVILLKLACWAEFKVYILDRWLFVLSVSRGSWFRINLTWAGWCLGDMALKFFPNAVMSILSHTLSEHWCLDWVYPRK